MRIFIILALFAIALFLGPDALANGKTVGAQGAAKEIFCGARDLMMGNLGVMVGLLIAVAGLYTFLISDQGSGLLMMLAGVVLTALPGLYMGFIEGYNAVFGEGREIKAPEC